MRRLLFVVAFVLWLVEPSLHAQEPKAKTGHYLFAWAHRPDNPARSSH